MYRCKECNSTEVESKMWVHQNTFKISDMVSDGRPEDNFCINCEQHVELYDDELLSKKELAKQLGWTYELWVGEDRLGNDNSDTYYWYDTEGNAYCEEEFKNIKKENL